MSTQADYLRERGFSRGRYVDFASDYGHCINNRIGEGHEDEVTEGWWAFTTTWELGPFPDPVTAYVAAELADWGRK